MIDKISNFKKVINFGMEQLVDYLNVKAKDYEDNYPLKDSHPIVYRENLALLEEEKIFIAKTVDFIKGIDVSRFNSPEEYRDYLKNEIKTYYKKHGIPNVCYIIINEKIDKCFEFYCNLFC
ncbi:MAG TPA: hypothetical protein PK771_00130 [Spirochaetota bacterium]|nr:hypothetical protein [Spirochaetota bacterium]